MRFRLLIALLMLVTGSLPCFGGIINILNPPEHKSLQPAVSLLKNGKLEEARTWLKQHCAGRKNELHPDLLLVGMLTRMGRVGEARTVLESLAVKEPDRVDVRMSFCQIAIRDKRWFDGLQHSEAARSAVYPKSWTEKHIASVKSELQRLRARCCEGRGDWKSAKALYEPIAKQEDSPVEVLAALGRCEFELKNITAATEWYRKAWQRDRKQDSPPLALAVLFDASGQHKLAEEHFRKAVSAQDADGRPRAKIAFARWLLWNNRPAEIPNLLSTSQTRDVQQDCELLLGMAARMQRRFDDARTILSRLHKKHPNVFSISNQLALVLIESENEALRSRALQIAEANARNFQQLHEAWSTLGWIQFSLGDLASARQNLSRGLSGGVVSRDTAWQLAQVYRELGNTAEADKLIAAAERSQGPFFCQNNDAKAK